MVDREHAVKGQTSPVTLGERVVASSVDWLLDALACIIHVKELIGR